jgi:hypothetical protein
MKILTILFTGMTLISCAGLKCWVIIADNLKKAGWSLGSVLFLNCEAGTIWVADTRPRRKAFRCARDEKLTAFYRQFAPVARLSLTSGWQFFQTERCDTARQIGKWKG